MSTGAVYQELLKQEVSQFATLLHAYQECSSEIQAIVDDMVNIIVSPESTPDERDHATDAVIEALFPSLVVDVLSHFDNVRVRPEFTEAGKELDEQERHFAETVKRLMDERGITQQKLADETGVTQPAISNMLNRQCRPQQRTVAKFAEALGVEVEELWPSLGKQQQKK
jgi:lambda repressor-like predicted transcriptional regulator